MRSSYPNYKSVTVLVLVLLVGLLPLRGYALMQWTWERYGFNTWVDGWEVVTNGSMDGATGVSQTTNVPPSFIIGAYSLQVDLDLRTNPVSKTQGRVITEMTNFIPHSVDLPINLSNKYFYATLRWPNSTDPAVGTNRYRLFVRDDAGKYNYDDWVNIGTNGIWIEGALWKITGTNTGAETGFDPCRIEAMGIDFATGVGSTGAYQGPFNMEAIRFDVAPGEYQSPSSERYSFSSDTEGFTYQTYATLMACTNVAHAATAPSNSTGCLEVDVHLDGTNTAYNEGEIFVDMISYPPSGVSTPVDLFGKRVSARIYCPGGLLGTESNPNYMRLFCKDNSWNSFYGSLQHITATGYWVSISMTPDTNMPRYGWMDAGFDPTQIRMIGLQIAAGGGSTQKYDGKIYVDGFRFEMDTDNLDTNDLRYGFEPSKMGWGHETFGSLTGITSVAQSTNYYLEGSNSLRLNVAINNLSTNRTQGAAKVDMRWYPPPIVRVPFDLTDQQVHAYVYCPSGSESTNPANPNQMRLYVNDGLWNSQYGDMYSMRDGEWVKLTMTVTTNGGLQSTNIIAIGVDISMIGTYNGPLYLDHVDFPADPLAMDTNSQHIYDFGTAYQSEWWKWDTNPDGWGAQSWTNVYYATNYGVAGSVALAADAEFVVGGDEMYRKGVFEIAYQPALNLSTKDHRKIQAKLKFEPPTEGIGAFFTSLQVFDKITDQWYYKEFNCGGMDWNIVEFNLDNASEYSTNGPTGPMDVSAIGFITVQIYANSSWTGTVYVDDVIVGGRETGTNYTKLAGAFVQPADHKFTVGGTNLYFVGANIEYLQTESDAVLAECLGWAESNGVQLIRTWAMQEGQPYSFQPERGVWNELMFEHMDRVVAASGDRGIRLMLAVLDNWAHNGGVFQYMHWVTAEHPESVNTNLSREGTLYHDQFWTNTYAKQWYKTYVTKLLNRTNTITGVVYKEDPTIFAWEIVNEPRCESDFSGATIHNWLNEMSDFVRGIDTNHMLGNGEEGGYVNTYEFADTIPWEVYPDNYYHYGVYGVGSPTCDVYGCGRGHGVDFISDNKDDSTYVEWQGGFYTNKGATQGEWRVGNSNINFCTARIYVDQKEYNVWRTNQNSSDQRIEWINDHIYDANNTIGKPMILEEFGIHSIGWIFNGSYGQVQLVRDPEYTETDRVNIYDMYYDHLENCGVPGSFFWNFGFQGMWDDPFHLCEEVFPWYADTFDGSATTVTLSQAFYIEGSNSLKLSWDVPNPTENKAIFRCPTNEKWVLRVDDSLTNDPPTHGINRTKFFWNIYNPSVTNTTVALVVRGTPNWYWCESEAQGLSSGWNKVMFDLSAGTWGWTSNGWVHEEYLIRIPNDVSNVLENVQEVDLIFYNLSNGTGSVYIDDIQIKRDDGFVIYSDDPVCAIISNHAAFMSSRNVATNDPGNTAPVASNVTIVADTFVATNVTLIGTDVDGDFLSYCITLRPTNGWVFGTPPSNLVYKSKPGAGAEDSFTYLVHDGKEDSSEATVTITLGSTDTDNDYIEDAWEYLYFPKLVQWWPYDSDSLTNLYTTWDWDGDGFNDYSESRAGTDPTNAGSYLYVAQDADLRSPYIVEWPSVGGKYYSVERSTNLLIGFEDLETNVLAIPPMNVHTDSTASGVGPYSYRIRVE